MAALAKALPDLPCKVGESHFGLVRIKRGGASPGTWFHPKLATRFAQWLDEDFAVWCDLTIDRILRSGIQAQGSAALIPLFLRPNCAPWQRLLPARVLRRAGKGDAHALRRTRQRHALPFWRAHRQVL